MNYIIQKANTIEKLMEEVELKIHKGYMPQGGVAVTNRDSEKLFLQAMSKI